MTRGIFIAGNDSAVTRAIEAETSSRVDKYAVAIIQNRLTNVLSVNTAKSTTQENQKRMTLDWNPSSPISARTLVLAAENRLDCIDEAILVCTPPSFRCSAVDLPLSDVEIMINDHIKGWFFLVKELAAVFSSRKRGTLAFVYSDISAKTGKDDSADILGLSSNASFRALTNSLLSAAHNEPYVTMGFSTAENGNEAAFAAFVYKHLDEGSRRSGGKLHKFGRFNFF